MPAVNPIEAHLEDRESTHTPAAEASAARLLLLLRQIYSGTTEKTVKAEDVVEIEDSAKEGYDFTKLDRGDGGVPDSIKGILQFVKSIRENAAFDAQQVQTVIGLIVKLAKLGTDHWTQNRYYSQETQEEETIDSGLGETLNLVCLAVLDSGAYPVLEGSSAEKDTAHRVESLFQCLVDQPEWMCSGGRQHEFLFLLNHSYCRRNEKGELDTPVRLIEDYNSFMHAMASEWLAKAISKAYPKQTERFEFIRPWALQLSSEKSEATSEDWPYETWLEAHAQPLKAYLETQSQAFLLPPSCTEEPINNFTLGLTYLGAPNALHPAIALMWKLSQTQYTSSHQAGKGEGDVGKAEEATSRLQERRKEAEVRIRAYLAKRCETLDDAHSVLTDFSRAQDASKEVEPYLSLTLVIDTETGNFIQARDELAQLLEDYFTGAQSAGAVASKDTLPYDFETTLSAFHAAEKAYKKAVPIDFIKNFFALITAAETWKEIDAHFKALDEKSTKLFLSDDKIGGWLKKYQADDGAIEISPYEINLILFQALKVRPDQWSDLYTQALDVIVNWLLKEPEAGKGLLQAVRESYPKILLDNLFFLLQIKQTDALTAEEKIAVFTQIYGTPSAADDSFAGFGEAFCFTQSFLMESMAHEFRGKIISAAQDKLGTLINGADNLRCVLSNDNLNDDNRTQILTTVKDKLSIWIHNDDQLSQLLSHDKLADHHRTQILTAVESKLGTLIQNYYRFCVLLDCDKLNEHHRTQILKALEGKLRRWILYYSRLEELLDCDKLNDHHRTQILTVVKHNLGKLNDDNSNFRTLLRSCKLTDHHRTQILTVVKDNLRGYLNLVRLLNLEELGDHHRSQILDAFKEDLSSYIESGHGLRALLECDKLTDDQRTQIWESVENKFNTLIGSSRHLAVLLDCDKLTDDQLTQIWEAVEGKLGRLIWGAHDLCGLLRSDKLTAQHCSQIMEAVKGKLGILINTEYILGRLLSCDKLTDQHRTEILTAVKGEFDRLILFDDQLIELLCCNKLSDDHRIRILEAVPASMRWIQSYYKSYSSPIDGRVAPSLIAFMGANYRSVKQLKGKLNASCKQAVAEIYLKKIISKKKLRPEQMILALEVKHLMVSKLNDENLADALDPKTDLGKFFATHRNMSALRQFSLFQGDTNTVECLRARSMACKSNDALQLTTLARSS